MAAHKSKPLDLVAWARGVNAAWLVHGGLGDDAADYMDHLAVFDPGRLLRSCRRAWKLVGSTGELDDPKPWFYGGLFSLATSNEAARFLADHPFVAEVVPSVAGKKAPCQLQGAGKETWDKIERIREAISRLPGD